MKSQAASIKKAHHEKLALKAELREIQGPTGRGSVSSDAPPPPISLNNASAAPNANSLGADLHTAETDDHHDPDRKQHENENKQDFDMNIEEIVPFSE